VLVPFPAVEGLAVEQLDRFGRAFTGRDFGGFLGFRLFLGGENADSQHDNQRYHTGAHELVPERENERPRGMIQRPEGRRENPEKSPRSPPTITTGARPRSGPNRRSPEPGRVARFGTSSLEPSGRGTGDRWSGVDRSRSR